MRDTPLLMTAPMVRATLAGLKTNTRRVVKPQPEVDKHGHLGGEWLSRPLGGLVLPELQDITIHCPYGGPGDRIWIRETFFAWGYWARKASGSWEFVDLTQETKRTYRYAADEEITTIKREADTVRWWRRPAIFMPLAASRITLVIQRVRVERLQAISEADALAEGIQRDSGPMRWVRYLDAITGKAAHNTAQDAFFALWAAIYGAPSLEADPYVWAIAFERLPQIQS